MFDTNSTVEPIPNGTDRFRACIPLLSRIGLGLLFVLIGYTKFDSDPRGEWFQIFERIGVGQWFRYLTGGMQVAGGILVLLPWTFTAGAALLASTMFGAFVVDALILRIPFFFIPLMLLFAIVITWVTSR